MYVYQKFIYIFNIILSLFFLHLFFCLHLDSFFGNIATFLIRFLKIAYLKLSIKYLTEKQQNSWPVNTVSPSPQPPMVTSYFDLNIATRGNVFQFLESVGQIMTPIKHVKQSKAKWKQEPANVINDFSIGTWGASSKTLLSMRRRLFNHLILCIDLRWFAIA